jgi:hypothetical protein
MFNNNKYKNTRLADTGLRDMASDVGGGFLVGQSDELAAKAVSKLKPGQLVTKVKPGAGVAGAALSLVADPLINEAEARLIGPAKMYSSRMSDAIKNIAAIKKFIPNDPNLIALLDSLSQQMNAGAQMFKKAAYNNKINRIAVVGDFVENRNDYGRQALVGAGAGALTGALAGTVVPGAGNAVGAGLGALTGGISGLVGAMAGDVAYHFKNNSQKASWNAGEMQEKLGTMADQIEKINPQVSITLKKLGQDIKNYIEVNHEKKMGANMKNSYDQDLQKMQQGQQGQNIAQDPQISQGVQYLMGIYQQGMQYYNAGDAQNYNTHKAEYTQGLQNLNQYITQNYPDQDPNMILGQYVQQMQQMQQMQQQQMQQQGNISQPQ